MAKNTLPSAEFIRQSIDYNPDTGIAIWRQRPPSHFDSEKGWKVGNSQCAGKPCGWRIEMKSGSIYLRTRIDGKNHLLHRVIWKWMTGEDPKDEIDHRDGSGLNNVWTNLREATHQGNLCNTKLREGTKCPRGVYRIHKNFAACITSRGVRYNLGTYNTPELAHAAYLAASKRLHEEFSFTNREADPEQATRVA